MDTWKARGMAHTLLQACSALMSYLTGGVNKVDPSADRHQPLDPKKLEALLILCKDYKSLRAKMSCGHAVTPMSLTDHCRRLLDQRQCRFVCGKCDREWSFEEVRKMALLTPEEVKEFEDKRFHNASKQHLGIRECPGLEILKTYPDIVFESVKGVTGCPSIRACPTCGMLVVHDGTRCKNVVCRQCKVSFCFVCLKTTTECQKIKPYSYFDVCSSGVAPRQTSIPVRQIR
ncbi:uncharacterized protein LOC115590568 isoform X1 [Sparus aurata]|uniref:E3 ubiquitin-protein ligase RNF144A-like n=1 Tax=Sparus aurata TaxID=8175 RepID=A0A671UX95_SPAAU|nr:uncharacterized protein LOC115590568 isoform X1 [Sparus aurata]